MIPKAEQPEDSSRHTAAVVHGCTHIPPEASQEPSAGIATAAVPVRVRVGYVSKRLKHSLVVLGMRGVVSAARRVRPLAVAGAVANLCEGYGLLVLLVQALTDCDVLLPGANLAAEVRPVDVVVSVNTDHIHGIPATIRTTTTPHKTL